MLDALKGYVPVALAVRFGPALRARRGHRRAGRARRVPRPSLAGVLPLPGRQGGRDRGRRAVRDRPAARRATLATWLIIAAFFRYSSLASIVAAVFAPFWQLLTEGAGPIAFALVAIALLLIWRHRPTSSACSPAPRAGSAARPAHPAPGRCARAGAPARH